MVGFLWIGVLFFVTPLGFLDLDLEPQQGSLKIDSPKHGLWTIRLEANVPKRTLQVINWT